MARDRFRDGAGVLATYTWEVGHGGEEADERTRNVQRTAPTSGVGFVRQQGESSPRLLRYTGAILTQTQYDAMAAYYEACSTRTVFYLDPSGTEYEVLITRWNPTRKHLAFNPRSPGLNWYWTYELEMEVIR